MRRLAAMLTIALLLGACSRSPAPEPFPQEVSDEWIKRYTAHDAAGVAALYTEDAQMLPPDHEIVSGQAAIQEFIARTNPPDGPRLEFATIEALVFGDYAHRQGSFRVKGPDGATAGTGKNMELWKKVGGEWKIHRDIWSWDAPPVEPADMDPPADEPA